jgi:putative hydrolase of HD superfamily
MARDIQFLYEVAALRNIRRQWGRFLNTDFDNIAEHHFRVMWTALVIARHEKAGDIEKIMKMALVHDIAEGRTGDADYITRLYTERKEDEAIKDMLKNTSLEEEFLSIWREYEERESIESKIVKDADNIEIDFELLEQEAKGSRLPEAFHDTRVFVGENKLYTKSAKKMWQAVRDSDPTDWFIKGRNRLTAGDWKK